MDENKIRWYKAYMKESDTVRGLLCDIRSSQAPKRQVWLEELDRLEPLVRAVSIETFLEHESGPSNKNPNLLAFNKLSAEIRDATDKRIEMDDCVEGVLYRIHCRNSNCGIWIPKESGFQIARTKFGSSFLTIEYHWDTGPPYGTARPYVMLEPLPSFMDDEAKLDYLLKWREQLRQQGEHY